MANKTKYNKTLIREILSELAVGKSIRSCLTPINKNIDRPCWETFRSWMRKEPELRQQYEDAKTDGIEFKVILADHGVGMVRKINDNINYSEDKEKLKHLRFKNFLELNENVHYQNADLAYEKIK